ncbi:hypothetical protein FCULG_00004420 [Fusarium culmorum]|uniref:Uncharacterized protein n=1 Tax=Fusarium culmorum TaxID=5516 RepID=A0A2T4HBH3_FUSCU|nr:hypothetical protein FCULG_00004420 [Fusarium culmorum]
MLLRSNNTPTINLSDNEEYQSSAGSTQSSKPKSSKPSEKKTTQLGPANKKPAQEKRSVPNWAPDKSYFGAFTGTDGPAVDPNVAGEKSRGMGQQCE